MTIPANLKTQLAALQTAFEAASPVEKAPPLVFADLDNKAWLFLAAIDGQVASVGTAIDGFAAGTSALDNAARLTALAQAANDELDAYEMRSFIGRFAANLELVEGYGKYFEAAKKIRPISTIHAVLNFRSPEQSGFIPFLF